eukprot:CAMPEP_0116020628 /NCGR_PEP_ID=MMETSP0321-20121206/9909_1 /TAXON_ID=163516 /ORGANISM="Leptocylindrus danicus var. danicus, Strain B650" /LENGTH=105 /DNA_ID=CAMNT_0003491353 /DNA_START=236 /DNA_END=553 /DNA_ORIENTATION=+
MAGLASTVAQGMAFGTGSAIAHRAVGAVAGSMSGGGDAEIPAQTQHQMGYEQQQPANTMSSGPCADDKQMFFECLQMNKGDQSSCAFLYDALKTCQRSSEQVQFS